MVDKVLQVNSLRLNKIMCGSGIVSPIPTYSDFAWFYNGSTKFETSTDDVKVFEDLQEAVDYFTENTSRRERTRGQFVAFALENDENWVLYVYYGPDTSNKNYSDPKYWKEFCSKTPEISDIIQETLNSNKEIQEFLYSDIQLQEVLSL